MYDIEQVRCEFPHVVWSISDIADDDRIELIGMVDGKGHIILAPKALVETEGLKRCAEAVCAGLRYKGLLPPTDSEIAIREYLASKVDA